MPEGRPATLTARISAAPSVGAMSWTRYSGSPFSLPTNAEHAQDSRLPSRKIADDLRAAIERGELVPGQKVPSERELARRYGAARNTAREAIRLLSEDGLLLAQQGRGVFVRPAPPLIRFGNDRYSPRHKETGLSPFLMECAKQGKTGRFEVLSIERIVPPPTVADRLQVSADTASVLRRENVFWADDDPVQRVTTYTPWELAEGTGLLAEEVGHPYGIHGIFEDQGHVMTRIREEVSARMPRPEERRDLRLPPGVPVLDVLHTSLDQLGQPYELTRFVMRADLTGLLYDVPVE
jgi:GntR family transcriptional regulator